MNRLEGKVALMSLAATGQGAAQARMFVREGARVVIGDSDIDKGHALADELGPHAVFQPLDVGDAASWSNATALVEARFGRLDILVNGVGINFTGLIEDTIVEDFERVVRINQLAPLLGMQAAIPPMRRTGGGVIINSISAGVISYCAGKAIFGGSKSAVRTMTSVAARELGVYGIRVNAVLPGGIATELNAPTTDRLRQLDEDFSEEPIPRIGRAEEVAYAVVYLASDEASYCTGTEIIVDGGTTAAMLKAPASARQAGPKVGAMSES